MNNPLNLQFVFSSPEHLEPLPLRRRFRRLLTPSREEIVKKALRRFHVHAVETLNTGPMHFSEEFGFSGTGFNALPVDTREKLNNWSKHYRKALADYKNHRIKKNLADYEDYSLGIVGGMLAGLALGWIADNIGFTGVPVIEGLVRLIAGSGDSIGGILVLAYARLRGRSSAVELFALGTVLGMLAGPVLQTLTLALGLNPVGIAGSLYALAYSLADNVGGLATTFIGLVRKHSFVHATKILFSHPFLASTVVVLVLFTILDLLARNIGGFSPATNLLAAIEAALLNGAAIIPIIVVWYYGTRLRRPLLKTLKNL